MALTPGSDHHKVLIRRLPSGGSKVQEPALSHIEGFKSSKPDRQTSLFQEFSRDWLWSEAIAIGQFGFRREGQKRSSQVEAGRKLDGGVLPLLMSSVSRGLTETCRRDEDTRDNDCSIRAQVRVSFTQECLL